MADIVSVTMTLLSVQDLAVVTSTGPEPAEDDDCYKIRVETSQAVCRERVEILIELFREVI